MFGPEVEAAIAAHMLAEFPKEGCGIVTAAGFQPLPNLAEDPEQGFDCALAVAELQDAGTEVLALVHSHPHRPPDLRACEGPSQADMEQQLAMGLRWGLTVTDGHATRPTLYWGPGVPLPPLEGRQFRHGPAGSDGRGDCYALIKDYYQLELGVELPEGPRDERWWEQKQDLYGRNFKRAGFRLIDWDEMRPHDVVLGHMLSEQTNHGGIYVGNSLVLHHLPGRLSRREPIGRWRNLITHVLRHESQDRAAILGGMPLPR